MTGIFVLNFFNAPNSLLVKLCYRFKRWIDECAEQPRNTNKTGFSDFYWNSTQENEFIREFFIRWMNEMMNLFVLGNCVKCIKIVSFELYSWFSTEFQKFVISVSSFIVDSIITKIPSSQNKNIHTKSNPLTNCRFSL